MSIVVGSSFRISASVLQDSVAANLTNSTAVLRVRKPNGVESSLTTVVDSLVGGTVHADVAASVNILSGTWLVWAEVVYLGGAVLKTLAKSIVISPLGTLG